MAYRISTDRPLGQEVQRLFNLQVVAAVSCLTDNSRASAGRRVHEARKHVKKARALVRLAQRPLGDRWRRIDEELRTVNRALGPLADATRHCETIRRVQRSAISGLPAALFETALAQLETNATELYSRSRRAGVLARAVRLLDSVRRDALTWDLSGLDAGQIMREIRDAHAAARRARHRARQRPIIDGHHRWRRHVKHEWHLLRLIADLTGNRLIDEQHQLAALGARLGQVHDIDVLTFSIAAESPLNRHDTARLLVAMRGQARDERRQAHVLGSVLDERPGDLACRLRALWGMAPRPAAGPEQTCLRRA